MDPEAKAELEKLEPLVGQWTVEAVAPWAPPGGPRGHAIFQWGPGEAFLVQHYFDSRGVVRRYATSIEGGVWSLRKLTPGFAQRFLGELNPDGNTIEGAWEKVEDGSSTWELDFKLIYRRVS